MQNPSKILFVLPGLEPGGAERVIITLMNGINRDNFSPSLLSVQGSGALRASIHPDIPFHTLDQHLTPRSLPSLLVKIKKIKPDVIISTMSHMNFAVLALKIFFPKTTFIIREAITPSYFFKKRRKINFLIRILFQKLYPKADHIISPSHEIFDEFKDFLFLHPDKFSVLKNPVSIEKLRTQIDLSSMVDEPKKLVRFVACGRLHKQKGFARLIKALPKLEMPYPWRLDIIGEGEERKNIEALIAEHNLSDNVYLQGLIMPPYSYFAAADYFLLPSHFEGLPNVVLESLACGTPVIATTESGGIDEIRSECGEHCVRIVQDMESFIEEMNATYPKNKIKPAPSLLALGYYEETILKEFNMLLSRFLR